MNREILCPQTFDSVFRLRNMFSLRFLKKLCFLNDLEQPLFIKNHCYMIIIIMQRNMIIYQ